MSIKGSQTEKNLLKSFAGESQAKNRYTFYAKKARKEGYQQIAAIFEETALNEEQHAKQFFKFLEGGDLEITATYPAGIIGSTSENLKAAAMGENEEHSVLYPEFAKVAEEEGFKDVAFLFKKVSDVEEHHEARYLTLLKELENGTLLDKPAKVKWKCRKCGHIHEGTSAPEKCPTCQHPKGYFEILCETY